MAATPLSEVTRYLDLPRHHDRAGKSSLDTDEVVEVRRLADIILARPRGDRLRTQLFRQLADRFGVTTRTVYRYLLDDVELVECRGYVALFRVPRRGKPPLTTATASKPRMVTVTKAFEHVGPQLWRCALCHTGATYSNPLVLVPAPAGSPYSHLLNHREGCAA